MSTFRTRLSERCLAALLVLSQALLGCPPSNPPLAPAVGLVERRELGLVAVPGGLVDVAGGKLLVQRTDLVLDTRIGRETLGAIYDSASGAWRWSFDSRYDGASFVDESGASFAVAALAVGAAIPGSWWLKLDATRMQSKGGLVHEYGAGGLLVARYWASDPYPRIRQHSTTLAGALRITAIDQCSVASSCSPLVTLDYDPAGRLISITDHTGRRAEFAWDGAGRLASARDALDVAEGWPGFRYGYVGTKLASVTNSEGEEVRYAYLGVALTSATQTGPGAPEHRFQYEGRDGSGLYHTRSWNPLGEERRYAYDALGRLVEQHEVATGERSLWAWSGERVVAHTLPNGATTHWSWTDDDVQTRTDPSGNIVTFSYAPNGVDRENPRMRALAEISDMLGPVETRSYDAAGRLLQRVNGAGDATVFSWAQGALASETSSGITRRYSQYGAHGHAERVLAFGIVEQRVFDAVGNLLQGSGGGTPLAGGIEARAFDADRNLAALTLRPLGGAGGAETITLEHRSDGQRLRVLRGGDDHEFVYDAFGRAAEQRERVDGAWQATRFGYDAAGRPSWIERPNGMREELDYGPANRVAAVRRLRGAALESTLALSYQDGQLASVDDSESGVEQYAWDAAGRQVATTYADGERLELQYDLRSRLAAESFVSAQGAAFTTLGYEYDLADRRVGIGDAGGLLWSAEYANGRLSALRYGSGAERSFSYRSDGLLSGSSTRDGIGALIESSTLESQLELDPDGVPRIRQRATTATYGGVDVLSVEEYELRPYPDGSPASTAGPRIAAWNDGLGASESYAFDGRSNLLQMGSTQFAYNAEGNRLLSVSQGGQSVGSYAWDAAGFASQRNGVPLVWNAAGRLLAHGADTLAWDGFGRLREAQIGGVTARFRFGGRMQADSAGQPQALDLGEVVVGPGGAHRYRHLDFRGNVKFVSDAAGEVVAHYRYAPFGLDAVFGADDDPVRFVARAEIGELMLLGARVYDPAVGRFLSPDPLFQVVNQFAYTLGNPIWFSDPDGLDAEANASASGIDSLVIGLSLLGAALGLVATLLKFAPTPQTQALAAVLGLISALIALLIALILAFGRPKTTAATLRAPQASGAVGPNGGFPGGDVGSPSPGCSPAALTALPDVSGWLRWLLLLQLLLGWLVLRRRRAEGGA